MGKVTELLKMTNEATSSKKPSADKPKQEKYESTVDDLVRDTKNSIKQLVDMVNNYSVQLKLGKKVRLEDFMESIEKLEQKLKQDK